MPSALDNRSLSLKAGSLTNGGKDHADSDRSEWLPALLAFSWRIGADEWCGSRGSDSTSTGIMTDSEKMDLRSMDIKVNGRPDHLPF